MSIDRNPDLQMSTNEYNLDVLNSPLATIMLLKEKVRFDPLW
jgi:hypothetical protein